MKSKTLSTADEYFDYPNPEVLSANTSATETTFQQSFPGQSTTLDADEYYDYPSPDTFYDTSVAETSFERENMQTQSAMLMEPVISSCFILTLILIKIFLICNSWKLSLCRQRGQILSDISKIQGIQSH